MRRVGDLLVDEQLLAFLDQEAPPASGVDPGDFWTGLSTLIHVHGQCNRVLLAVREELQTALDEWNSSHDVRSSQAYLSFLQAKRYIVARGPAFAIDNGTVDAEIATTAGPQLVVPVDNARYALNAANARWGSLYDALYGTDAPNRSCTPCASSTKPVWPLSLRSTDHHSH